MKHTFRYFFFAVITFAIGLAANGQEFKAKPPSLSTDRTMIVEFEADANYYYVLYQGTNVVDIRLPADMVFGANGSGRLNDRSAEQRPASFYRVQRMPIAMPQDTDGDGIDDVWELQNRRPGAALNANDAHEDHNGNGIADIDEVSFPIASFEQNSGTTIAENNKKFAVNILFSKPYSGTVSVLLGGNAVFGQDFNISGYEPSNQSAEVLTVGQKATFEITILDEPSIDPDRFIMLSILEPKTNAVAQYKTSASAPTTYTLRITEGDLGLYAGLLTFTNTAALGSHPVRMGLRSGSNGTEIAYIDATKSPFFRQALSVPANATLAGGALEFPSEVSGQSVSAALQRSLGWSLRLGATTNMTGTLLTPARLQITGLSASGRPVTALGYLQLVPIESGSN